MLEYNPEKSELNTSTIINNPEKYKYYHIYTARDYATHNYQQP